MMMMIRVPRTFSKIVCFFAMGQLVAHRYLMSSRWWETEGHRARIAPVAGSEGGLGAPRSREAGREMRHDITNTAAEKRPGPQLDVRPCTVYRATGRGDLRARCGRRWRHEPRGACQDRVQSPLTVSTRKGDKFARFGTLLEPDARDRSGRGAVGDAEGVLAKSQSGREERGQA